MRTEMFISYLEKRFRNLLGTQNGVMSASKGWKSQHMKLHGQSKWDLQISQAESKSKCNAYTQKAKAK